MVMDFRPHILKATISGPDIEDLETGDIIPGDETHIEYECRVSPNGGGKETRDQDGNKVVYSYLIHASEDAQHIPFGTSVQVIDAETGLVKAKGKVIGCFSNSLNTRIWI